MNLPMIDTLIATLDLKDYENSVKDLLIVLESKKNEAKLVGANSASEKVLVTIGNKEFQILPNGSKGYAYILHNDFYEVNIAQYRSRNENFYPIKVKIKSECLWSQSPIKAWDTFINWLNLYLGEVISNKISRVDLCCHTDNFSLSIDDIETFKGKFFMDQVIRDRRKITGVNLGSRSSNKIYCRIYDKLKEVQKKKRKLWFYDLWLKAGLNINNVWNIEFQLDRGFFNDYQIDCNW